MRTLQQRAEDAGDHLEGLALPLVLRRIAALAREPWIREAASTIRAADVTDLGIVVIRGPDDRTPWPARRLSWIRRGTRGAQADRRLEVAYTLDEKGRELVRWTARAIPDSPA